MALLQINLCGGGLGVPGLVRGDAVVTLAVACSAHAVGSGTRDMRKPMTGLARRLMAWCQPAATTLDPRELYGLDEKILHLRSHAPVFQLAPLTGGAAPSPVVDACLRASGAGTKEKFTLQTGFGRACGDMHGDNLLADALNNFRMIFDPSGRPGLLAVPAAPSVVDLARRPSCQAAPALGDDFPDLTALRARTRRLRRPRPTLALGTAPSARPYPSPGTSTR